ncbi:MAG: AAA family ATPase [Lachnospiraceae bacterium]|nr:AAA family ATPase [Lachnospiraceae bacterium]
MKVIILNGPMGIGKTTVGTCIADKHPGTAFIDGDWCMDIHPFVGNRETKEMAVDNILHMMQNYRDCAQCNMIVLSWLMDDAWVREKLSAGIRELGLEMKSATLICEEEKLRERWKADQDCPWRTEEWLEVSIRSLAGFSQADDCIDTGCSSVEEIADRIMSGA